MSKDLDILQTQTAEYNSSYQSKFR